MSETRRIWVGSIVLECREFARMREFWMAALGYEAREPPTDDWVVLHDPANVGPNLSLQKVDTGPDPDYRYHLDLYSSAPEEEAKRLVALGARLLEPAREDRDFVTLADPDGNPFDVIDCRGFSFGQRSSPAISGSPG
ncbi:MAG TPA: VOC family protein [Thermoplasmata archaeon]|nr:VOC family protein [Thermoplasmata archaeon]